MACNITYNKEGGVVKVVTDSGATSILYRDALKTNVEEDALNIWSVAQTDMFKNELPTTETDKNGEPRLKTVLSYITSKNTLEELTPQEISEVKSSLISTPFTDAHELAIKLKEALLVPTKQTLKALNLYNNTEIANILEDPTLKASLLETAQKIINTNEAIILTDEVNPTYLTINVNEKNILGKYKVNNPHILEANVIEKLGGIKNEEEFEQALQNSEFESLKTLEKPVNKPLPVFEKRVETNKKEQLKELEDKKSAEKIRILENKELSLQEITKPVIKPIQFLTVKQITLAESSEEMARIKQEQEDIKNELKILEDLKNCIWK